jgi:hypothetical protein
MKKATVPFIALALALAWGCEPAADYKGALSSPDGATEGVPEVDELAEGVEGLEAAEGLEGGEALDVAGSACAEVADCEAWASADPRACHEPECRDGQCAWKELEDDTGCDDQNDCTEGDACQAGKCLGAPKACDDQEPCTTDSCTPGQGCQHADNTLPCDDGDGCTINDRCQAGHCQAGPALPCDDGDPCTADGCDDGTCTHVGQDGACDDGNPCTGGDTCTGGRCLGTPDTCDDGNACTQDACDPLAAPEARCGHVNLSGTPCSDGSGCTSGDTCAEGYCVGTYECDDGNPCTEDGCDGTSCTHAPLLSGECDDGNPCTTADHCAAGVCTSSLTASCDDSDPCTFDHCDPTSGCKHSPLTGPACDDKNLCTLDDRCNAGTCKGTTNPCDDKNECTDDSCTPGVGCQNKPAARPCDDKNECTTLDFCLSQGQCVGVPRDCDDGDPCTLDSCDPLSGDCVHAMAEDGGECDDQSACTTDDVCQKGVCAGQLIPCDDADPCTLDSCDALMGCKHAPGFEPQDAGCLAEGVCAAGAKATCASHQFSCDYSEVIGYEPGREASCDGLDNDCDGLTDEGLCLACHPGEGFCSGAAAYSCNSAGSGFVFRDTCPAGTTCLGAGMCLPDGDQSLATNCLADPAYVMAGAVDRQGRLVLAYPLAPAGGMRVVRVAPSDLAVQNLEVVPTGTPVSVALGQDGTPLITYRDTQDNQLVVAAYEPTSLARSTLATIGGLLVPGPSLPADGNTLALSYTAVVGQDSVLRQDSLDLGAPGQPPTPLHSWVYKASGGDGWNAMQLSAARLSDGAAAVAVSNNLRQAFVGRYGLGSTDTLVPFLADGATVSLSMAAFAFHPSLALLQQDAAGVITARVLDAGTLAARVVTTLPSPAMPQGRVAAYQYGDRVLLTWIEDVGGGIMGVRATSLTADGALEDLPAFPFPLFGFDPLVLHSPLGYEVLVYRMADGSIMVHNLPSP